MTGHQITSEEVSGWFSRGANGSDKQCSQERFLTQSDVLPSFEKKTKNHKTVDLQVDMIATCKSYQQNF